MKIGAVIQARMGSSRLPGKVLMDLNGAPMLARVVERARAARSLDSVTVATSTAASDDRIAEWCAAAGVACERGSEQDVLDRYHHAATRQGLDAIVRLTADCPLLDPAVIDLVVCKFRNGGYDYVSNTQPPTFPDGLDTEVFSRAALERAWGEAALASEREHVTPYIWKHPELFRLHCVTADVDRSSLRWTVDDAGDLELARRVLSHLGPGRLSMEDALRVIDEHPEILETNAGRARNEGYQASLEKDGR